MLRCLAPFCFGLAILLAGGLYGAEVESIDRDPIKGAIVGVDNQLRLKVKADGSDVETGISLDAIQGIDFGVVATDPNTTDAPLRVVLVDGSVVFGAARPAKDEGYLTLATRDAGNVTVDVMRILRIENRSVVGVRELVGPTAKERDDSGFECKGHFADDSSARMAFYGATDKGVTVEIDGFDDLIERQWKDVRAIVRNPGEAFRNDAFHALASTKSGETFIGEVTSWKEGQLVLKTRFAGDVTLSAERLSTMVFRNGRFAFVSDLEIAKVDEEPYFRGPNFKPETYQFAYRRDLAQGGGPISIQGKRFAKGLGVHAISRLTYRVDKRYTSFISTLGVDDSAGKLASIEYKVLVDGKEAQMEITRKVDGKDVTEKVTSFKMKKDTAAVRLKVELVGVREVTLVVLADEKADINDRANWASAMFIR